MRLSVACFASLLISSTVAAQTTLVAHYKLDETSGTVAADSSGNGNDGVYTGAGVTLGQAGIWSTEHPEAEFTAKFLIDSDWGPGDIDVVAFLQDMTTGKIYSSSLGELAK